jgi:hypothetical protein
VTKMATMSAFILLLLLGGNNVVFRNSSVASPPYRKVTEQLQTRNVRRPTVTSNPIANAIPNRDRGGQ